MLEIKPEELFKYLDGQFGEVKSEIAEVKSDIGLLQASVDNLSRQVLSFQQEMAIMTMKVGRMESWIIHASQKIGIPYEV